MKKRTLALILCATMAVAVTGCGRNSDQDNSVADTETEAETELASAESSPAYVEKINYNAADYVTLGEYKGIEVTLTGDYEVSDQDVIDEINTEISSAGAYYVGTDKKRVEDGDVVNIDYVGTKDGTEFQGGSAQGSNLEIGSNSFIDGFETGLIGSNVGDEVELNLTFPEDYPSTDLAGQDVVFTVTVNQIMEAQDMSYDLLNDDYASSVMNCDTKDAYIEQVKSSLQSQAESTEKTDLQTAVLEKVVGLCDVSGYPDGLVDERIEQRKEYYQSYATAYGMDLATFLSSYVGMTEDEFDAQLQENIPDSVSQEMVLIAIADKEGISDDTDAYDAYVDDIVSTNGFTDKAALLSMYDEAYVKRMYCQDTVMDFLTENANVTYGTADTEEVNDTEA